MVETYDIFEDRMIEMKEWNLVKIVYSYFISYQIHVFFYQLAIQGCPSSRIFTFSISLAISNGNCWWTSIVPEKVFE